MTHRIKALELIKCTKVKTDSPQNKLRKKVYPEDTSTYSTDFDNHPFGVTAAQYLEKEVD